MTPRISPHTQSPHTTIDYLAALTNCRISSGYLRIPCPAHGGTNTNLALWVNGDGIAARCHSAGCSYADIAKAIEDRYGISINPRRYHDNPTALAPRPTNARRTPGPGPKAQDLRPYALQLWQHSVPIPNSRDHPARMWLAARQLWRPELPLPGSVRWIGAEHLRREFQGAGAIIAMASPPAAWTTSWPGLPDLSSAHLVYVAGDGSPAVDRGLTKRTYAAVQDAVVVLGCPLLETGDWGNAGGDAKVDLKAERFGAEPPASLVDLVDVSSREIYAACGFNAALWGGSQAASVREAWRLDLFGVLSPLGRLVEAELKDKLDDEVSLSWQELRASDLSGRARAFQSMVGGGMDISKAIAVAGLMVED